MSGYCGATGNGTNLTWELTDSVLTISGSGPMASYSYSSNQMPWRKLVHLIKQVVISDGVTSIGIGAFRNHQNLQTAVLGESIESIGMYAFTGCVNLRTINFPNSITLVGECPFWDCLSLTSPLYNERVFAFMPINYSGEYVVPNGIEKFADLVFWGCIRLTSITIPSSVKNVGRNIFAECTKLKKITVDSANPIYDSRDNCNAIIETATNTLVAGCKGTKIPTDVSSIGTGAFFLCSRSNGACWYQMYGGTTCLLPHEDPGLTSVVIPSSVIYIASSAFGSCGDLNYLVCKATTPPTASGAFSGMGSIPLYVPAESVDLYKSASGWMYFDVQAIPNINVNIPDSVEAHGTTRVEGDLSAYGETLIITAVPDEGWLFDRWSDGYTENPREVVAYYDTIIYPIFKRREINFSRQTVSMCEGDAYEWRGKLLTDGGVYYDSILAGQSYIDSIYVLELTVYPTYFRQDTAEICEGEGFSFYGQTFYTGGTHIISGQSAYGCDSTHILNLTVHPAYKTDTSFTLCTGDYVQFNGKVYYHGGYYEDTAYTVHGCDSIYRIRINEYMYTDEHLSATICNGDSVEWRGRWLKSAGTYKDTVFHNESGCHDYYEMVVKVKNTFLTQLEATITSIDYYSFNGRLLRKDSVYYDTLQSVLTGCDSVIQLTLHVTPKYVVGDQKTICEGETYYFNNMALDSTGVYTTNFHHGDTDSIVTLTLTVYKPIIHEKIVHMSDKETYLWYDSILTHSGIYDNITPSKVTKQ